LTRLSCRTLWPGLVPVQRRRTRRARVFGVDHCQCAGLGLVAAVDHPIASRDRGDGQPSNREQGDCDQPATTTRALLIRSIPFAGPNCSGFLERLDGAATIGRQYAGSTCRSSRWGVDARPLEDTKPPRATGRPVAVLCRLWRSTAPVGHLEPRPAVFRGRFAVAGHRAGRATGPPSVVSSLV
jgi:hypothetical protein